MSSRAVAPMLFAATAVFPFGVRANDSSALLEAGGIVLTKSADVSMDSEDLTISRTRVRVSYLFRNTSGKDLRTRVAFPVPPIPVCAEEGMGECEGDMQILSGPNPMQFRLWIDGTPTRFESGRAPRAAERQYRSADRSRG